MDANQEQLLFQTLGRIEGKLEALVHNLKEHTEQDAVNFEKMDTGIVALNTRNSEEDGAKKERERTTKIAGTVWGGISGFVSALILQMFTNWMTQR